jgi:hypothetical protein
VWSTRGQGGGAWGVERLLVHRTTTSSTGTSPKANKKALSFCSVSRVCRRSGQGALAWLPPVPVLPRRDGAFSAWLNPGKPSPLQSDSLPQQCGWNASRRNEICGHQSPEDQRLMLNLQSLGSGPQLLATGTAASSPCRAEDTTHLEMGTKVCFWEGGSSWVQSPGKGGQA